jgi:prepilin signal peptidase PulO-like enzyme (type II secretory pathway)
MMDPDFLLRLLSPAAATGIGAAVGSFLNVCIYRIPIGLTVARPKRSFCPSCRIQIKAIDNIPVISWLRLRGRCCFCHAPIPVWYFLVEVFAAIGSGIACLKSGLLGAALFLMVFSILTYTIRTARGGFSSRFPLPSQIVTLLLAGCLYFQRVEARWANLWRLFLCCLGAYLILRAGYTLSIGRWNKRLVILSFALASGWLGAWAAAAILISARKLSPDTEDAVLLACISVGPVFW